MYHLIIRPVLFRLNAETAHGLAAFFLKLFSHDLLRPLLRLFARKSKPVNYECMGINFPSRLGLAAGFDKDATMFRALSSLGFGFVEIGTVTPKGQAGNDKPRLFRLKKDAALINRMGFNNKGVNAAVSQLRKKRPNMIIGGNIGKNKATPNEEALQDYMICFKELHPYVDYFTVNVSSPNTPGLRDLQEKEPLKMLLGELQRLNNSMGQAKPILLKIAPDLTTSQIDDVIEVIADSGIEGVIATNTSIGREGLESEPSEVEAIGAGGLSGEPVKKRALEVVSYLREKGGSMTIIGVGGISSGEDAVNMINAGADLVQVYTGFVYRGIELIDEINRAIEGQARPQAI